MNKFTYLKLETKRQFKLIPYLLAATIILVLITSFVGFCASKYMNSNRLNDKKDIYFSSEDDSKLTQLIVNTLSTTKSLTSIFNVYNVETENIEDLALNENSVVSVVVPSGFLNSLMTGDNYPIKLYFSSTTSIYSIIIRELSLAAQTSLKSAQAVVYTLYDYYYENQKYSYAKEANEDLNLILIKKAFSRDKMFKKKHISSTTNLEITGYYIASGLLTIILLLGCIFILKLKSTPDIIILKLKQNKIGYVFQSFVKTFTVFLSLYTILVFGFLIAYITSIFKNYNFNFYIAMLNGIALCLCSSAIINFISALAKNQMSSILLLFISVISCELISGAFFPSVFLPDKITIMDKYLPTKYMFNLTKSIISCNFSSDNFIIVMGFSIFFFVLTIIFACTRFSQSFTFFKSSRKAGK